MIAVTSQLLAQAQMPNAGFETWTDTVTCTSWNGVAVAPIPIVFPSGFYSYSKTTDKNSGSFAMKMTTSVLSLASQTIPGMATLGTVDLATQTVTGGVAFTDKPVKLNGFYKYSPVAGDSAIFLVVLYQGVDTMATGSFIATSAANSYIPFSITLNYSATITGNPDVMNIVLLASAYNPHAGSVLKVDDIVFDYTPLNVQTEENQNSQISIFPNPSNGLINIDLSSYTSSSQINIFNALGELVYKSENCFTKKEIDLSKLANGVYSVEVFNKNQKSINKLIIEK